MYKIIVKHKLIFEEIIIFFEILMLNVNNDVKLFKCTLNRFIPEID